MQGSSFFSLDMRFKFVLSVLALLAIAGFVVLEIFIQGQQTGAAEVNVAGRQRMLSQRIISLAARMPPAQQVEKFTATTQRLKDAVQKMASSHVGLTRGNKELGLSKPQSAALKALYFGPIRKVDADLKEFVTLAQRLLDVAENQENQKERKNALLAFDSERLLADLNLVVDQYQMENETKVAALSVYQAVALLITLVALFLSWLIVFKPMVHKLNNYIGKIFSQANSLRLSETRLKEAQTVARLAHWDWDIKSDEIAISDECLALLGREPGKWAATPKSFAEGIFESDFPIFRENILAGVENGEPVELDLRYYHGGDKNNLQWIHFKCVFEIGDDGRAIRMLGTAQDVTEQKNLENSLIAAKEEAELANRAKSTFLANMSHELRTPLNAIIGFSDMMRSEMLGPMENESYKGYSADIYNSGNHLQEIIADILDVSKIEAGRLAIHCEDVNFAEVLETCATFYERSAKTARLGISIDIPEDFPTLSADPVRVKQVSLNLISNSIKHTPAGGIISVQAEVNGSGLAKITFSDTGNGIPAEDLPFVTRPFFQTGDMMTNPQDGSGLGLYIVKSLVELHGGSMQIDSTVGEGTKVVVTFPLSEG